MSSQYDKIQRRYIINGYLSHAKNVIQSMEDDVLNAKADKVAIQQKVAEARKVLEDLRDFAEDQG
jgi:hypothetical protein